MRRLLILASTMVLFDITFYSAIAPLLPDYVDQLGLSKAEAGILSAAYAAGTLIASLPAGWLATRIGPRRTTIAGLGLLALSSLVFGFAEQIVLLDLARFAQGVAGALIWSGALSWLITATPPERRGKVIGTALGTAVAGALIGPAIGALAAEVGTDVVFSAVGRDLGRVRGACRPHPRGGRAGAPAAEGGPRGDGRPAGADRDRVRGDPLADVRRGRGPGAAPPRRARRQPRADRRRASSPERRSRRPWRRSSATTPTGPAGGCRSSAGLSVSTAAMLVFAAATGSGFVIGSLLLASLGAGICFTPALTMLSETAEAENLHQGFAAGLSNMAWASGQVLGGLVGGGVADVAGYALPGIMVAAALAFTAVYATRCELRMPDSQPAPG